MAGSGKSEKLLGEGPMPSIVVGRIDEVLQDLVRGGCSPCDILARAEALVASSAKTSSSAVGTVQDCLVQNAADLFHDIDSEEDDEGEVRPPSPPPPPPPPPPAPAPAPANKKKITSIQLKFRRRGCASEWNGIGVRTDDPCATGNEEARARWLDARRRDVAEKNGWTYAETELDFYLPTRRRPSSKKEEEEERRVARWNEKFDVKNREEQERGLRVTETARRLLMQHSRLFDYELPGVICGQNALAGSLWQKLCEKDLPILEHSSNWALTKAVVEMRTGQRNLDALVVWLDANESVVVAHILHCANQAAKSGTRFCVAPHVAAACRAADGWPFRIAAAIVAGPTSDKWEDAEVGALLGGDDDLRQQLAIPVRLMRAGERDLMVITEHADCHSAAMAEFVLGMVNAGGQMLPPPRPTFGEDAATSKDDERGSDEEGLGSIGNAKQYRELNRADFNLIREIGRGSFGFVRLATWRGIDVAVKELTGGSTKELRHEAAVMARVCNHDNVAQFVGVIIQPKLSVVTRYMQKHSLEDMLVKPGRQNERHHTTDEELVRMAADAAAGVMHLHMENVVHRDLAARNLLVDSHNRVRVADFGFARFKEPNESACVTSTNEGPLKWMAPESLQQRRFSQETDCFSFGVVMYEIWAGSSPWPGILKIPAAAKVIAGERMESPEGMESWVVDLMSQCWVERPDNRPSMKQIHDRLKYRDTYDAFDGGTSL